MQRTNCVSLRLRIIRHTVAVVYWPNEILKSWCTVRNRDEQNAWPPMSNFVGRPSARIWVLDTWITERASCETGGRHVEESDYGISCFLIPIQTFQILFFLLLFCNLDRRSIKRPRVQSSTGRKDDPKTFEWKNQKLILADCMLENGEIEKSRI